VVLFVGDDWGEDQRRECDVAAQGPDRLFHRSRRRESPTSGRYPSQSPGAPGHHACSASPS
jgi:hypothetical protein